MLNDIDAILQRACPLVAVPLHGPVDAMTEPGQRILVAKNGVFVQFKRTWLDAVQRIGTVVPDFPLPYGMQDEFLTMPHGPLPVALIEEFLALARAALPNEAGAVLVWSRRQARVRLVPCGASHTLPARLICYWPKLDEDEDVIMDLHSHGKLEAGFSAVDDRDDTGFNLCGVLGNVHRDVPSGAFRLCANGVKLYPRLPWDRETLPWHEWPRACRPAMQP